MPSGETDTTEGVSASSRVPSTARVPTSHSLIVPSHDPEARSEPPPAAKATDVIPTSCPSRVAINPPDFPSHSLIVPSQDPEARVPPSTEEKESELTTAECFSVANDL